MKKTFQGPKKIKVSSFTVRDDAPAGGEVADVQHRKKKSKVSTCTPKTSLERAPIQNTSEGTRTLQSTKLKAKGDGRFRLRTSRGTSGVAVPNVVVNDPRTTEEILDEWFSGVTNFGWDEGYVNSFVNKDLAPPTSNPDVPSQSTRTSRKGVSTRLRELGSDANDYSHRTQCCLNGPSSWTCIYVL